MKTIKITVYNVIGNKTYENNPDCNVAYCVTCGTMKEAERELRKCVEEDYDGFYDDYDDDEERQRNRKEEEAEIERAVEKKYLSVGELTVIYEILKQTVTVSNPKEIKALAKAAADYAFAVDEEMESGDYHIDDTCKTEAEIETHNENVNTAIAARQKLYTMIKKVL